MLTWHALLISSSLLYLNAPQITSTSKTTATTTATIVGSTQRRYTKKENRSIMAFSNQSMALALVLSLSLALPSALAGVICEDLHINRCAFAVSSTSKRCVLESMPQSGGKLVPAYQCKTSDVVVENISDHIETEACVRACGLERKTVGISSDSLMDPRFTQKLCSPLCSKNCPNIVDLYSNLASGEGVFLSDLCEKQLTNPRRAMISLLSSGEAAGPVSGVVEAVAPSPSP